MDEWQFRAGFCIRKPSSRRNRSLPSSMDLSRCLYRRKIIRLPVVACACRVRAASVAWVGLLGLWQVNCTPKVGHPLQLTRCSFFYEQIYITLQIPTVLHYLHIRSQQRTADHYGISRTHLRRWIRAYQEGGIGALEHPQSKTMPQHRKNPFIADKPDQEKNAGRAY